jgi:hypothetical protein
MEKFSPSGPKIAVLENVQSDWHQRGAHGGYGEAAKASPEQLQRFEQAVETAGNALREHVDKLKSQFPNIPSSEFGHVTAGRLESLAPLERDDLLKLRQLRVALDNAEDARIRAAAAGVPDAPFKDAWTELALKERLLDIAHNRRDIEGVAVAPASELRDRGEVISPEYQDVQLPRTLEKLLGPVGSKREIADLGIPMAKTPGETVKAPMFRLTPEMLQQIRDRGFPLLTVLAMLEAQRRVNQHQTSK